MSTEIKNQPSVWKEINELLDGGTVDRHSYFQLKHFVIGKEPTLQAKLWRCLTEMKTRCEQREALLLEMEESLDNLEINDLKIKQKEEIQPNGETEKKIQELEIRKMKRRRRVALCDLTKLKSRLQETEEEIIFFHQAYQNLSTDVEVKPYDDLDAQTEYWNEKLTQKLRMNALLNRQLDPELVTTILALNDEAPVKGEVCAILEHKQKILLENNKKEEKQE